MGFQDRPYNQTQDAIGYSGGGGSYGRRITYGMPRPSQVVKYLLIINLVMFVLQLLFDQNWAMTRWLAAWGRPPIVLLQVWRLVTFQFMHGGVIHILFNMLALYFLGPSLERSWGPKKFLAFYLICGAVGGMLYVIGDALQIFGAMPRPLVGASGGVLGLLVACAILFPHYQVILIMFPVPIRFAAILFTVLYVFSVLGGRGNPNSNAGGDLCHLGGMATGFIWVMSKPYLARWRLKQREGVWQRKQEEQQKMQFEVDRILSKVHQQGVQSLTRREKQILQQATEQQKRQQ